MEVSNVKKIINKLKKYFIMSIFVFNRDKANELFIKYLKNISINIVGRPTFISMDVYLDGTDYSLITIGDKSVISREVTILTHDFAITRAKLAIEKKIDNEIKIVKAVKIGNNSFVGAKSILLPGADIGNNTIIGAGSIVLGRIPDNVVAAGNPCKVICGIEEYYERQIKYNGKFIIE